MTTGVLVAVRGAAEAQLVAQLDAPGTDLTVVRRCADVAEVLAAGLAGLGAIAVVSADHADVDRTTITRLAGAGVRTVLLCTTDDEQRCLALGAAAVLDVAGDPAAWSEAVRHLARTTENRHDASAGDAPGDPPAGGAPADDAPAGTRSDAAVVGSAQSDAEEGAPPPGRIVVVWGPRGSPGRTSVAVNLAHELAAGGSTLLVDADTEAPSLAQVLGLLDETAGIAAAARLAGSGRLDADALRTLAVTVTGQLRLLTGLTRADRWRELPVATLDVLWEQSREIAQWTVVDVGAGIEDTPGGFESAFAPRRHQASLAALGAADVIVVVGAGEPVGMHRLVLALQELTDAGVTGPAARRIVVVNRVRASAAGTAPEQAVVESLARFAGVNDAVLVPDDRPAFDKAVLRGVTLTQVAATSPVAAAIRELAARVAGRQVPRRPRRLGRTARAARRR